MSACFDSEREGETSLAIMVPAIFGIMAMAAVLGFLAFLLLGGDALSIHMPALNVEPACCTT